MPRDSVSQTANVGTMGNISISFQNISEVAEDGGPARYAPIQFYYYLVRTLFKPKYCFFFSIQIDRFEHVEHGKEWWPRQVGCVIQLLPCLVFFLQKSGKVLSKRSSKVLEEC